MNHENFAQNSPQSNHFLYKYICRLQLVAIKVYLRKYEWQSTSLYWCYVSNVQNNANQPKNPQNFVIKNLFKIMPKKEIHLSFTFLILKVVKEFRKSWDRNTT